MKRILMVIALCMALAIGGCARSEKFSEYLEAQVQLNAAQAEHIATMIGSINSSEQGMAVAYYLGGLENVKLERMPEWHESALPWFQAIAPYLLGGWNVGDKGNGSINIKGDHNSVAVHNLDNVKSSVYDPDSSRSWSYLLDYDKANSSYNTSTEFQGE